MHSRTVSFSVAAPRDIVFNFLADIENLPSWAAEFCERLELHQGRWWAYTTRGEMFVDLESNDSTGVIDLRVGPAPDRLELRPIRVLPLAAHRTLVNFTLLPLPGLSDELYERRYQSLLLDMSGILRRFGGGELHVPEAALQLAEMGLN